MDTNDYSPERRREERKPIGIFFLVKIGQLLRARGVIKDMNPQGVGLKCPDLFKARHNLQAKDFIDSRIKITIPSKRLTVDGTIAWVNLSMGEGALRVTRTSDTERWLDLYDKGE